MPRIKHHFKLDAEEREELGKVARSRKAAASNVQRARAILALDRGPGGPSRTIAEAAADSGLSPSSIDRLKVRVGEVGPLEALGRKRRQVPPVPKKITGDVEAHIAHIACTEPPEGAARWTLKLIADRVVELELIGSISKSSVGEVLKKTRSAHG